MGVKFVLLVVIAMLLAPLAQAVVCDSFTSGGQAYCESMTVSTGKCAWKATNPPSCAAGSEPLPPGFVGITSIPNSPTKTPTPTKPAAASPPKGRSPAPKPSFKG